MKIDISPRGVALLLFKNWILFCGIITIAFVAAVFYVTTSLSYYQAKATFVVRFGNDIKAELQDNGRGDMRPVSTDERREVIDSSLQILQSHEFAERIIREFGIDNVYPSTQLKQPPFGTREDAAVARLIKDIAVKTGTQTNVIDLSVFNPDRELAIKMVQRLLELYIAKQADVYENPQVEFTHVQTEQARKRLVGLQDELNGLRRASGIFDYSQQFPILLKQQDNIVTNIATLTARAAEAEGRQERLSASLGVVPTNVGNMVENDQLKELERMRAQLEDLKARQRRAGEGAAGKDLDGQIAELERTYQGRLRDIQVRNRSGSGDLYQTILVDYLRASAEAKAAAQAIDYWKQQSADIDGQIVAMQKANQKIVDVARETDLAEEIYKSLSRRADEARVSQRLNEQSITRVSVIDSPNADPKPARPRKLLILLASLLGSVVLASGLVVVKEALSERIYLPQHIEQTLGIEVVASFGRLDRTGVALSKGV